MFRARILGVGLLVASFAACGSDPLVPPPAPPLDPYPAQPAPSDAGVTGDGGTDGADGTDAESGPVTCEPRDTDATPKSASYEASMAGQVAWVHDGGGFAAGYFHTYDQLTVGGLTRKVHVMLPTGYATECARYPVLYFEDGDTTFWRGGAANKTWDLATVLSRPHALGPVIVVAVVPVDRDHDYTHEPAVPGRSCCGLAAYAEWLAQSMKPFIDSAYRTKPSPTDSTLVGSSHGGLASFWAGTVRSDVFGNIVAMSSSFWVGLDTPITTGGPLATSSLMAHAAPGLTKGHPRIYLDWGLVREGGVHNSFIEDRATVRGREMRELLASSYGYTLGKDLFVVEDPLGQHDEESWSRRIGPALDALLAP